MNFKINATRPTGQAPLSTFDSIIGSGSGSSRAPLADATNADFMLGDPFGDADYGDADYGAPHHSHHHKAHHTGSHSGHHGKASPLSTWKVLLGDPGAPAATASHQQSGLQNMWSKFRGQSTGAQIAEGIGAAALLGGGTAAVVNALKKRKARHAHVQNNLDDAHQHQTIANQIEARQVMGYIAPHDHFQFYSLMGAHLNSAPLSPTEYYPADMLKHNLDRQNSDTPFEVETVIGTASGPGPTWTVTSVGVAPPAFRYYVSVVLIVGVNFLSGTPGIIYTMTVAMPLINGGSLNISSGSPFSFTLNYPFYSEFMIFPWTIVTNKPLLTLGQYDSVNTISFSITGLPSQATFNMIIPGSMHTWSIAMRNRFIHHSS